MIGVGVLINRFLVNYILAVDYWILMIILDNLVGFYKFTVRVRSFSSLFFILFYFCLQFEKTRHLKGHECKFQIS